MATSALGMGYDKPDLGFCVHVGSPDSPVAYYQQVGRAGRALAEAVGVLLPARDRPAHVGLVRRPPRSPTATRPGGCSGRSTTGGPPCGAGPRGRDRLRRGRLEALLKTLRVDGAVDRSGPAGSPTGRAWHYDADKYGRVGLPGRAEADLMRAYAAGERCLMQVLTEALDDPSAGRADAARSHRHAARTRARPDPDRALAARRHLRGRRHVLEPRKLWPAGGVGAAGSSGLLRAGRSRSPTTRAGARLIRELGGPRRVTLSQELVDGMVKVLFAVEGLVSRPPGRWPSCPMPSRGTRSAIGPTTWPNASAPTIGKLPVLDALTVTGPPPPADTAAKPPGSKHLLASLSVVDGVELPARAAAARRRHLPIGLDHDRVRAPCCTTPAAGRCCHSSPIAVPDRRSRPVAALLYTVIASLDGYTVDADGRFDWATPPADVHAHVNAAERSIGTYLYGRRLYETMAGWQDAGHRAGRRAGGP